jgi:hypothetical protein
MINQEKGVSSETVKEIEDTNEIENLKKVEAAFSFQQDFLIYKN